MNCFATVSTVVISCLFAPPIESFCPRPTRDLSKTRGSHTSRLFASPRYGPPIEDEDDKLTPKAPAAEVASEKESRFRQLIDKVLAVKNPDHVPSLLTKNVELILSLSNEDGVNIVESILQEAVHEQGEDAAESVANAIELILSFAETFVEEAVRIDQGNKQLLGDIMQRLSDKDLTASSREEALDEFLSTEKDRLTAGFLRHLDGECDRISGARVVTKESGRLLEMLRMIQVRVLEELGSDLGEVAKVLNQLVGFDSDQERLAVLDAGLSVQGPTYARQMLSLTEESLEGFKEMSAEPGLVERVSAIDGRLRRYLEENGEGDFQ